MKKRLLTWILAVVMILTTVTVVPFTASAAGASYADDATAIAAGYVFKVGELYYNSIFEAVVDVPENGTVYLLADYTFSTNNNNNTTMIGYGTGLDGSNPKTYTIDGDLGEANAKLNITTGSYGLDFYASNATLKNIDVISAGDTARTVVRISGGSTVTLKDCNFSVSKILWGMMAMYKGTLIIDGSTFSMDAKNNANYFFHAQNRDGDAYWCGAPTASSVGTENAVIINGSASFTSKIDGTALGNNNGATLAVNAPDVTLTGVSSGGFVSVSVRALTEEEQADPAALAAWKPTYKTFGGDWVYDPVAKIGEEVYTSLAAAVEAVEADGTIVLLDDLAAGIVANNGKAFTIDGDGHSVVIPSGPSLTVDAGTEVTITNITLNSTGSRNTVAMNGGTLNVGEDATIINTGYNGGNSDGNAIRGTGANSVVNVYEGATITAGTGAFVFDTGFPGTVNVFGGEITSSFYIALFSGAAVSVNIYGGHLVNDNKNNTAVGFFRCYNAGAGHSVKVMGGDLHFSGNSFVTDGGGTAMATPAFVTIGGTAVITNDKTEAKLDVAAAAAGVSETVSVEVLAGGRAMRLPAEARDGNSGVAFGSKINKEAYAAIAEMNVKTGTVILPTDLIPEDTDLTIAALDEAKVDYLKIENAGWYNAGTDDADEEDSYLWYGSIVNIKDANFDREFTGFGYVEFVVSVETIGSASVSICGEAQTGIASALAAGVARDDLNEAQIFMLDLYMGLVD